MRMVARLKDDESPATPVAVARPAVTVALGRDEHGHQCIEVRSALGRSSYLVNPRQDVQESVSSAIGAHFAAMLALRGDLEEVVDD
jgi:hypothetical protein